MIYNADLDIDSYVDSTKDDDIWGNYYDSLKVDLTDSELKQTVLSYLMLLISHDKNQFTKQKIHESALDGLDSDEEETLSEIKGWLKVMFEMFGVNATHYNLDSPDDVMEGTFVTKDLQHGHKYTITWTVVDYAEPEQGIECDVVKIDGMPLINFDEDYINDTVADFVISMCQGNNFFNFEYISHEKNPNFMRFRLVAPY